MVCEQHWPDIARIANPIQTSYSAKNATYSLYKANDDPYLSAPEVTFNKPYGGTDETQPTTEAYSQPQRPAYTGGVPITPTNPRPELFEKPKPSRLENTVNNDVQLTQLKTYEVLPLYAPMSHIDRERQNLAQRIVEERRKLNKEKKNRIEGMLHVQH